MSNPELTESNPELAKLIEQLESRYARNYDLTRVEDQATLAEAMAELGQHAAINGQTANLSLGVGARGIVSINVTTTPIE